MVNRVTLIGNLGKDPEVKTYDNGTVVGKFTIATNESYKDKEGEWQKSTEWHNIVVWGDQAERAEKYLKKGNLVYIEGKLMHRSWQDVDGNTRYITEVRANKVKSLEKFEKDTEGGESRTTQSQPAATTTGKDDGLPF